MDARLALEAKAKEEEDEEPLSDGEFDPLDEIDKEVGLEGGEGGHAPLYAHSWSKMSLIERTKEEVVIKRRLAAGEHKKQYFDPENPGKAMQGTAGVPDAPAKGDFIPKKGKTRRKFSRNDIALTREDTLVKRVVVDKPKER